MLKSEEIKGMFFIIYLNNQSIKMIRLVITLFVVVVTTCSVAYAPANCTQDSPYICGNTCTYYGKTCYCGGESFELYDGGDSVCISSSDCMFDSDGMHYYSTLPSLFMFSLVMLFFLIGNVICENAFVETEPYYHQGACLVQNLLYLSLPCKHNDGNYSCSPILFDFLFCRGYSHTAQCDE